MRFKIFLTSLFLMLFAFGLANGQSLLLDHVDGLYATDTIPVNQEVTFYIRIIGDNVSHDGIANGFRVYSPDGATWNTTVADTLPLGWPVMFPLVFAINKFSIDGQGADTAGYGGAKLFTGGLPANFNEVSYKITIGPIDASYHGKTIVLDSSFYRPTGTWKWAGPDVFPAWGGPYAFKIFDPNAAPEASLAITPSVLNFTVEENGALPPAQNFTVSETGGQNIAYNVSESITWLDLNTLGTDGMTPDIIGAGVNTSNITPGLYTGYIEITSAVANNSPQMVEVNLTVTPSPKYLEVNPSVLHFTTTELGPDPAMQSFTVSETGGGTITYNASETSPWMTLNNVSGTTPGNVEVSVHYNGLAPGTYTGMVQVSSADAENSPISVSIEFEVTEVDKFLVIDPEVINLSAIFGHNNPSAHMINVTEMNNFNIDFASATSADYITLLNPAGTTPGVVTALFDISAKIPGSYLDTIYFTSASVPDDGTTYSTLVYLEITPNNAPVVQQIDDFHIDECSSISAVFSATDVDNDPLTLWVDPIADNMNIHDNGNGTLTFTFYPNFNQAGTYNMTFYATDGVVTSSEEFSIVVDDCEPSVEPTALMLPSWMYAVYLHAIEPMTGKLYFGNFNDGHTVNDVQVASLVINGNVYPTSSEILQTYGEFVGPVMVLDFPINDFLNGYMPFFDTSIVTYTLEGVLSNKTAFVIEGEVTLRGHLKGDLNTDGIVDIVDLVYMVNFFYNSGPEPVIREMADLDQSGIVDIVDMIVLVNMMFNN